MSRVGNVGTKPEWILRSALHRLGFRYTVNNRDIFGKPDLAFRRKKILIFVHGCFWHQHEGCPAATVPQTNVKFWHNKFTSNKKRDREVQNRLESEGWSVVLVWECELARDTLNTIKHVTHVLAPDKNASQCASYPHGRPFTRRDLLAAADARVATRVRTKTQTSS